MLWLLIIIFFILILLSVAWSSVSLAPFVPARKYDLPRILALAALKPGENFFDLGSGNGRVIRYVAKNSLAEAIGVEAAWPLYFFSRVWQILVRGGKIKFLWANLFKVNLAEADVVYFFGMPAAIKIKLKQKLEGELKTGARVISYVFPVEGWEADKISEEDGRVTIYLYKVKKFEKNEK
jgi:SAM-dependent methyltransferase